MDPCPGRPPHPAPRRQRRPARQRHDQYTRRGRPPGRLPAGRDPLDLDRHLCGGSPGAGRRRFRGDSHRLPLPLLRKGVRPAGDRFQRPPHLLHARRRGVEQHTPSRSRAAERGDRPLLGRSRSGRGGHHHLAAGGNRPHPPPDRLLGRGAPRGGYRRRQFPGHPLRGERRDRLSLPGRAARLRGMGSGRHGHRGYRGLVRLLRQSLRLQQPAARRWPGPALLPRATDGGEPLPHRHRHHSGGGRQRLDRHGVHRRRWRQQQPPRAVPVRVGRHDHHRRATGRRCHRLLPAGTRPPGGRPVHQRDLTAGNPWWLHPLRGGDHG